MASCAQQRSRRSSRSRSWRRRSDRVPICISYGVRSREDGVTSQRPVVTWISTRRPG